MSNRPYSKTPKMNIVIGSITSAVSTAAAPQRRLFFFRLIMVRFSLLSVALLSRQVGCDLERSIDHSCPIDGHINAGLACDLRHGDPANTGIRHLHADFVTVELCHPRRIGNRGVGVIDERYREKLSIFRVVPDG